jgi:flagellar biosynthesis component FlhA
MLPDISVVASDLLGSSSYRVTRGGIEVLSGRIVPNAVLVEISRSHAAVFGLDVVQEEDHPLTGHKVFWTTDSPRTREALTAASLKAYDFLDFIALTIGSFCLRHPEEFLSLTHVHSLLREVEKRHPGLIGEGFGKEFVPVPQLTALLQELVRQGVSIRDFRGVIEGVSAYCSSHGVTVDSESPVEVGEVAHFLRTTRRRQVLRRFLGSAKSLHVVSISSDVERVLAGADFENKALPLALDDNALDALLRGLSDVLRPILEGGILPVALLCSRESKEKVLSITRMCAQPLFVTTFEELDPSVPVQQVGYWALAER